jgi:hypothetical protein
MFWPTDDQASPTAYLESPRQCQHSVLCQTVVAGLVLHHTGKHDSGGEELQRPAHADKLLKANPTQCIHRCSIQGHGSRRNKCLSDHKLKTADPEAAKVDQSGAWEYITSGFTLVRSIKAVPKKQLPLLLRALQDCAPTCLATECSWEKTRPDRSLLLCAQQAGCVPEQGFQAPHRRTRSG